MKRYAIFAADEMYGGLHGMRTVSVIDAESMEEALQYAEEASREILQSYDCIYKSLDEEALEYITKDMTEEEIEEIYDDVYSNDLEFSAWLIDETKTKCFSTRELDAMIYDDFEGFIQTYCTIE